ncbi:MAG: hypothetical protein LQ342_003037 [Letrouitia transgressa]|nr:MAG: hypothetical protein LQ342_003037 [Letrouitia transgressa]
MTTRGTTIGSIFLSSRSRSDSYTNTNTNTNTDSTPTSYSTPGSIWWKSDRRIRRGPQRRLFQSPHLPADDDAQPPTLYMLDGEVIAMEPPPSLDNRLDCVDAVWPEPRRSRMSLVGGAGRRSRLVVVNRGRESVESGSFSLTGPANGRQSGSGLKVMNKKEKCGELRSQEKENGEWKGEMFKPRTGKTGSCNNDDEDDGDVAGSFGMPVTSKELLDEVEDARRMVDERMDWFWVDDGGILRYKYCGLPVKELS